MPPTLTERIKQHARELGFAGVGVVPAGATQSHAFYERWLAAGHAGAMGYLQRHAPLKRDVRTLLPEARSVLVLSHRYLHAEPPPPDDDRPRGRVSRYARARDYHDVLHAKLADLAAFVEEAAGRPVPNRAFVDSGPVMERELAARAGLGWVGRNAMLIDWVQGSWLFLAELLLALPLDYDTPVPPRAGAPAQARAALPALELRESCGTCSACLDACPTGAIVADKTVDSRRCISYLTIELKGPVPEPLRAGMGDWVFGCDACQTVCPWNARAPRADEPAFAGDAEAARPALADLLGLDADGFRARFRHTPLWRPRRRGVLRNAAIALGNAAADARQAGGERFAAVRAEAEPALLAALGDAEPVVRGAAAWALGRLATSEAQAGLRRAQADEPDAAVRGEIAAALAACALAATDSAG